MIDRPSATVLPFREAAVSTPIEFAPYRRARDGERQRVAEADNVVVLSRFRQRRRRFEYAPPPDGEAA